MDQLRRKKSTIILFLLPGLLFFTLVAAFPLFFTTVISTFNWGLAGPSKFLGIGNFIRLFTLDVTFQQAFLNTMKLTLGCLLTQTPLAVLFAYLLRNLSLGKGFFKTIYFIPNMISSVVSALMWSFILNPSFGIVNAVLKIAGLGQYTRAWLGDSKTILGWVIVVIAWQCFGYHMLIYLTAMNNIANDIIEAAVIDGAGPWKNFWSITFPLITPIMKIDFILITTGSLRTFDLIYTMTGGGPNHATEVISSHLYFRSFQGMQFGYGSSMAVILIIICLAATAIINLAFRRLENRVL